MRTALQIAIHYSHAPETMHRLPGIDQQPDGSLKVEGDVMGGGVEGHAIEGYRALSGLSGEQQQVSLRDADAPADSRNQARPALHITFKFPRRSTVRGYRTVGSP